MVGFVGAPVGVRAVGGHVTCGRRQRKVVAGCFVAVTGAMNTAMDPLHNIAKVVVDFMNSEHKHDLLQYVLKFGTMKWEDAENIDQISLSQINQKGMQIDIVMCEDSDEKCVCVQESIPWADNTVCKSAAEVTAALSSMSKACGLKSEF